MKRTILLLLIAASLGAGAQQETKLGIPSENTPLPLRIYDTTDMLKLYYDTIPGALNVLFWSRAQGCLNCPDFQQFWIKGFKVESWYAYDGSPHQRICNEPYYLQADKEPIPKGVTVAMFVQKPKP